MKFYCFKKSAGILFLLIFCGIFFSHDVSGKPPVADLLLTGNLQGVPGKTLLNHIYTHNPYSVWFLGGNTLSVKEYEKKDITEKEKEEILKRNKQFLRTFPASSATLAILGNEDFDCGLHKALAARRIPRFGGIYVLDYIGARNNENPFLLKYIDILVNGKTLRFMGLGAWENLYPKKKDFLYRKGTLEVLREMGEYLKTLKKADFTILFTAQSLKYDKILAAGREAKEIFDLIVSNDPDCPLLLEEKNSLPIAGSGQHAKELRKIYFNPVQNGVGGARIQAWVDASYSAYYEKNKVNPNKNTKTQEKKKK